MFHFLKIIFLSLIESITEFLPISSTLHLLVVDKFFLHSSLTQNSFFLVSIQSGSLLALLVYYKNDIKRIIIETRKLKKEGYIVTFNLINAFIISGLLALFIKKTYPELEFIYSAYIMISLGFVMVLLSKRQSKGIIENLHEITSLRAFFIGVAQALSVFPGVSRLGATMTSGILLNIEKKNAITFSFLLGIPTMIAGTIYELTKSYSSKSTLFFSESLIAFASSFLFSLLLVTVLIKILVKINIKFFGYYRIIFGTILLYLIKL